MNEINLKLPEGLTIDNFATIVEKEFGDIQIINVRATSGSKAGNNYLSEISRITVDFKLGAEEKSKSFIVKDPKKASSDFINVIGGIEKELSWYDKILKEVDKLGINFGAKSFVSNKNVILLEDLGAYGYKSADRLEMLDLDHSQKALEALAKFHAVTHHLFEINKLPEIAMKDTQFTPGSDKKVYEDFKSTDKIVESLKAKGYHEYSDIIKEMKPNIWSKMQNALNKSQDFLCLVHGDYWTSNILFKYDQNEKVSDAKIVDFQIIRLSTPAYDLHFFICSSVQSKVRDNYLDVLFKTYLDTLNSTLKFINSNSSVSIEQFDSMMNKSNFIGPFIALTFLPIPLSELTLQFLPPNDLPEEDKKDYHPFNIVYRQKTFIQHFVSLLNYYKKNNVI